MTIVILQLPDVKREAKEDQVVVRVVRGRPFSAGEGECGGSEIHTCGKWWCIDIYAVGVGTPLGNIQRV